MDPKDFSKLVTLPSLRKIRQNMALSQRDLAARAGVTQMTIVRLERGLQSRPSTVQKLASALGVYPDELMRIPD